MPFPRTSDEILATMVAGVVAHSDVTGLVPGDVVPSMLGAIAVEVEAWEIRTSRISDSFNPLNAVGEDLDARIADMPGMEPRREIQFASGAVMKLTRASSTEELIVPRGSQFAFGDDPRNQVRSDETVTFAIGELTYPPEGSSYLHITALRGGYEGNAAKGAISVVTDAPSGVIACTNVVPLSGGLPREGDDELKQRMLAYFSRLPKCQPRALEFYALNFRDSANKSIAFAHAFEHPTVPAYTELVVDDGSGLTGLIQQGSTITGTIPPSDGSSAKLYHLGPAVAPITRITNVTTGITHTLDPAAPAWVSKEERGIIDLLDGQTAFSPGDSWSISGDDYQVYTGFLRELQALIEGSTQDPQSNTGLRGSGLRVKAMPPLAQSLDMALNLIVENGADFEAIEKLARIVVIAYLASLGPGQPYFESQLVALLHKIPGLNPKKGAAVEVSAPGVSQLFPSSARKSFSLGSLQIT